VAFEPATGRRWVQVYARRSGREYTRFMQYLQEQFPQAQRIRLVQDNLFPPTAPPPSMPICPQRRPSP